LNCSVGVDANEDNKSSRHYLDKLSKKYEKYCDIIQADTQKTYIVFKCNTDN